MKNIALALAIVAGFAGTAVATTEEKAAPVTGEATMTTEAGTTSSTDASTDMKSEEKAAEDKKAH